MAQAEPTDDTQHRSTEKGERKRKLILRELLAAGGKENSSTISDEVGFSSTLVRHHCDDVLSEMSPPLVERAGKERNPSGMDYVVYQLTPTGKTAAERIDDDDFSVDDAKSFAELRSEVKYLRERVAELEDAQNDLAEMVKELDSQ